MSLLILHKNRLSKSLNIKARGSTSSVRSLKNITFKSSAQRMGLPYSKQYTISFIKAEKSIGPIWELIINVL